MSGGRAGRLLSLLTSPRVLGLPPLGAGLDAAAGSTALPEALREPLARDLAASWAARGQHLRGEQVLRRAAAHSSDPTTAAILDASATGRVLAREAHVPLADARARAERCLELADAALGAGDGRVTRLLTAAAALTFHPGRHVAGLGSPFATPAGVDAELAPYRASAAWQRLVAPTAPVPRALPPGQVRRVVVLHDDDPRFVLPLVDLWRSSGVEVRVVGLRAEAERRGLRLPETLGALVTARWTADGTAAALVTELVGDADLVWQEWCQRGAVVTSLAAGSLPPVVVRAHSFELFTAYPHLIDPAALAGLVTVSVPLERLARAVLPQWSPLPSTVCPPVVDTERFRGLAKAGGAERTLGLVGWAAPDKDPVWALDLLAALRASDPAWRLRLIGPAPDPSRWPAHAARVAERMARPDVAGAVDVVGPSDDVAEELRHVGVGVSSSLRESYHLGLAEMVASGARPVVRDWPTLAAYGGAASVWPPEWVISEIGAAVGLAQSPSISYLNGTNPTESPQFLPSLSQILDRLGSTPPSVSPMTYP